MKFSVVAMLIVLIVGVHALSAFPDEPSFQWERILIPLYVQSPVDGALGSRWTTELSVVVRGEGWPLIGGYYFSPCRVNPCLPPPVPPGLTFYPSLGETKMQGAYLLVEAPYVQDVHANLRARDLSRQATDWGAEVPTVREAQAPRGAFELLDIPANQGYGVMLRLYHFGVGNIPSTLSVVVRLFQARPEQHVANGEVPLDLLIAEFPIAVEGGSNSTPGYAEIPNLTVPAPYDTGRYRVEVSGPDGSRIWGFATITNNETQHVTVISPR